MERLADPEVDVALVCEQMLCLAQVLWWLKRGGELSARFGRVSEIEGTTPKQQPCAYILPEYQTLTALPWLETPAKQKMQSLVRFVDMIQKSRDFHGQVITRLDEH